MLFLFGFQRQNSSTNLRVQMKCLWFITAKGSRNRHQQQEHQKLAGGYYYYFRLELWLLPLVHSVFSILHSLTIFCEMASFILARGTGKNVDHFLLGSTFHSTPLHFSCWPFYQYPGFLDCKTSFSWFLVLASLIVALKLCSRYLRFGMNGLHGPKYLRFFTSFCTIIQISILLRHKQKLSATLYFRS